MIERILFPTDLGLYSQYVLHHVLTLAEKYGAQVHVIHVVEPIGIYAESVMNTYLSSAEMLALKHQGQCDVFSSIRAQVVDALHAEFIDLEFNFKQLHDVQVVSGDPEIEILKRAEALKVDLIVMGSHTKQDANPNILGSVASKVMQLSNTPIYLVPTRKKR